MFIALCQNEELFPAPIPIISISSCLLLGNCWPIEIFALLMLKSWTQIKHSTVPFLSTTQFVPVYYMIIPMKLGGYPASNFAWTFNNNPLFHLKTFKGKNNGVKSSWNKSKNLHRNQSWTKGIFKCHSFTKRASNCWCFKFLPSLDVLQWISWLHNQHGDRNLPSLPVGFR